MLTGVKSLFIDTNILVYAHNTTSPWHAQSIKVLQETARRNITRCISTQSLREYFAGATRSLAGDPVLPVAAVLAEIQALRASCRVLEDTHAVSTRLFTLVATANLGGRQIHDANIVATMATYGIRHLLTHNVADFNRFASVVTIIPLSGL